MALSTPAFTVNLLQAFPLYIYIVNMKISLEPIICVAIGPLLMVKCFFYKEVKIG